MMGRRILWQLCLLLFVTSAYAQPLDIAGTWHVASTKGGNYVDVNSETSAFRAAPLNLAKAKALPVAEGVKLQGGHFVFVGEFDLASPDQYVLDFKNTSTIAFFRHRLYSSQGTLLLTTQAGGIQSGVVGDFFLRHARKLSLNPGRYYLVSDVVSPNFVATPQPYIESLAAYNHGIKLTNSLTLVFIGVFVGLGIYYATLSIIRRRFAEGMYTLFIAGNIVFNAAALLVVSDVLDVHQMRLVSMPVLFSNIAYILFVMGLFKITRASNQRLYQMGVLAISIMAACALAGIVWVNWALELSRYGVAVFLTYGLIVAFSQMRRNDPTAKRYIVAVGLFFVSGFLTITASSAFGMHKLYIEHMGLMSVAIEVMLLALVLAYQFYELQQDKERALHDLQESLVVANTDALTGLPNRHALVRRLSQLPSYGSVTFIDLDGLKFYNDTHGHEKGDELLCEFGRQLKAVLMEGQGLYRLGGDEFSVLCPRGDIAAVEASLVLALKTIKLSGFIFAGASAGSAYVYETDTTTALMRLADSRMYQKKRIKKTEQARKTRLDAQAA